jgi:hypothetical protein
VVRGDDVLDPSDERPLLIKLDVEGYELKALRGMIMTIRTRRPAILTELNGELLAQSGDSPGAIFDILHPLGYEVFAPERTGFRTGHRLRLHPLLREELVCEKDVLWLIPHQTHWRRLAKTIQIRDGYWRHR